MGGAFQGGSGERLHGMQEVTGSIPVISTRKKSTAQECVVLFCAPSVLPLRGNPPSPRGRLSRWRVTLRHCQKASPWGSCRRRRLRGFPSRENGIPEHPQTLRYSEIINNFSAEYAQSKCGAHSKSSGLTPFSASASRPRRLPAPCPGGPAGGAAAPAPWPIRPQSCTG